MKKVLFVCTQNVFRSLSAEYLLKTYLVKQGSLKEVIVSSAGTHAYPDYPYSFTLDKLKELGVEYINHNQTRITKEVVSNNDIIICMTKSHKRIVESLGGKAFLFNEVAFGSETDLEDDVETDTIGKNLSLEEFVIKTIDRINSGIPKIAEFVAKD